MYHIVNIDTPECRISCRNGQLTCSSSEGEKSVPLEDVAAVIITSFSATIHSRLLLEAAKQGVGLIICEQFKPASLVLPANRSTDTLLTRAQIKLPKKIRDGLWQKTVSAKIHNQLSLSRVLAPEHENLEVLDRYSQSRRADREAPAAKAFWKIFSDSLHLGSGFKRGRTEGSLNCLLNFGYAVLLSTVLQKCFGMGIDPTFGIHHVPREQSTPLAYDLMEPFRPCVDWRVAQWVQQQKDQEWAVTKEFRRWITGFPVVKTDYLGLELEIRGCIEGVIRSFRKALISEKTGPYKPWIQESSKWAG